MTAENIVGMRRKISELLGENRKLKDQVKEFRSQATHIVENHPLEQFIRENAVRLKPFEPDSPEWQAELTKINAEMDPLIVAHAAEYEQTHVATLKSLQLQIGKLTRSAEAQNLAMRLAIRGSTDVLLPIIEKRIEIVIDGDQQTVRYLAADGSETTPEGLTAEFLRDPALAPVLQDSKMLAARAAEEHQRRVAETLGEPAPKPTQH